MNNAYIVEAVRSPLTRGKKEGGFSELHPIDLGTQVVKELIKILNFTKNIPICIEKSAWSGTCGAVIRLKNAKVINNTLTADGSTIMQLIKVDAKHIIPLK